MTSPPGKVEGMSDVSSAYGKTGHVVEGQPDCSRTVPGNRVRAALKWLYAAVCVIVALSLWITPVSHADDGDSVEGGTSGGEVTITSSITDTENLLGSDVSAVTDAIADTLERTGVSVRLLYLASFATDDEPETWARDVLDSTEPDPNTVLLAVASHDGSLVVAVSSNSDAWLRNQETVDELSQAALDPLIEGDTPNWSGSAIAMMDAIATIEQTSHTWSPLVVGIVAGVAVLIVAVIVVIVVLGRRRRPKRHGRSRGRRSGRAGEPSAPSTEDPETGEEPDRGSDASSSDASSAADAAPDEPTWGGLTDDGTADVTFSPWSAADGPVAVADSTDGAEDAAVPVAGSGDVVDAADGDADAAGFGDSGDAGAAGSADAADSDDPADLGSRAERADAAGAADDDARATAPAMAVPELHLSVPDLRLGGPAIGTPVDGADVADGGFPKAPVSDSGTDGDADGARDHGRSERRQTGWPSRRSSRGRHAG